MSSSTTKSQLVAMDARAREMQQMKGSIYARRERVGMRHCGTAASGVVGWQFDAARTVANGGKRVWVWEKG